MKGETELADALLVRSLINARRVFTKEDRKQIADAIGVDSDRKERINKIYQENYGADIRDDLKTLNKAAIERAERTRKDLAEQERKAREAREAVGDLLD
jgi:ribosomal protein L12E/L44/L45/RPP1/RPP2